MGFDYDEAKIFLNDLYDGIDEKYAYIEDRDERYFTIYFNNWKIKNGGSAATDYECQQVSENLKIMYPGKKSFIYKQYYIDGKGVLAGTKNPHRGDYILLLNEQEFPKKHKELCGELYALCKGYLLNGNCDRVDNLMKMLLLTNQIGTHMDLGTVFDYVKLKRLSDEIFWTTLQEEVNYPNGAGKQLAFCRYIEAVFAAIVQYEDYKPLKQILTIEKVKGRCNNAGGIRPELFYGLGNLKFVTRTNVYRQILEIYCYRRVRINIQE